MPKQAELAPRPDKIPAWSELSADQKKLYARQMEAFAASLSHADAQFGRVLDALEASGELANTIVIIVSDNGASAEGGLGGLFNEAAVTGGSPVSDAANMAFYDAWGGPQTYPHYSAGWAVAGDTPLRYYKQVAHEGGSRVPLVVSWPKGIPARGELRKSFVHVSDVAPTILQMTGVPLAEMVNNVKQLPMEGRSFAATLKDALAFDGSRAQYVELYGNRGLWQGDWGIVTSHRTEPWDWKISQTFDEPWELYNLKDDPGQTKDLAALYPERVKKMAALFEEQAARFNVRPHHNLSEAAVEGMKKAKQAFVRVGGKWRFTGPVSNIPAQIAPPINIQGFTMTGDLDLPTGTETGPVFAMGGQLGGIGLYLREGKPVLIMNSLEGETVEAGSAQSLGNGTHSIRLDFKKGKTAADGVTAYQVIITADGRVVADHSLNFRLAQYLGLPATFGVARDAGSPVMKGYRADGMPRAKVSNVVFDFTATGPGATQLH